MNMPSPPGDTIRDVLNEKGWAWREFADRLGVNQQFVIGLLNGRRSITPQVADWLAETLGSTQAFWLEREANFRSALMAQRESLEPGKVYWIRAFGDSNPLLAMLVRVPIPDRIMDACWYVYDSGCTVRHRHVRTFELAAEEEARSAMYQLADVAA